MFLAAAALTLLNPILCYVAKVKKSLFLKILGFLISIPQLIFLYAAIRFSAVTAILIIVFLLLIQYYFLFSKSRKITSDETSTN
jgi:integral membrane sensor domain MASE1